MKPWRILHKRRSRANRRKQTDTDFVTVPVKMYTSWVEGDSVKFSSAFELVELQILASLMFPGQITQDNGDGTFTHTFK